MATSDSRRHAVDPGVFRRLIHIVILIGVVIGVRACGGTVSAEDQLGAGTQWFAERTGLAAAKERWDKSIRPPIAAMTNAASDSLYRGVARTLDNAEAVADRGAAWVADTMSKAVDAVASALRALLIPSAEPTSPQPNSPPRQAPRPSPAAP
jgi:hypothetical protein